MALDDATSATKLLRNGSCRARTSSIVRPRSWRQERERQKAVARPPLFAIVRGKNDFVDVIRNRTSADFFKIYAYDFVSGRPFTRKEVEGKEAVCVITDALAERLFGKGMDAGMPWGRH